MAYWIVSFVELFVRREVNRHIEYYVPSKILILANFAL